MTAKERMGHKGSKCYTNGIKNHLYYPGDNIPEGWWPGKTGNYKGTCWRTGLTKEDPRIQAAEEKRLKSRIYTETPDNVKIKISQALLGCKHSAEAEEKRFETLRKNGTNGTSKAEDAYYKELVKQYGIENVKRWHKDPEKYPWRCDFYIISEDLYIEFHGTWLHGPGPFDPTNQQHLELLNSWKIKNTDYYNQAIYNWTDLDVRKLKMMRKNNLNFKIIYPVSNLILTK